MKNQLKALLQKIFGFKNYLLAFSLFSIAKALRGNYEKEFAHFTKLVPDEGIILDVGANIGITMVPLARLKKNAVIHAFEPIAENFSTLQRVARIYRVENIQLINLALGEASGHLKMIMPTLGHAKQQGLSKVYEEGSKEQGAIYHVEVKPLDALYDGQQRISAIKIDVENFEYEVLQGGEKILTKWKPVIYCELWYNEKRKQVFQYLNRLGYDAFNFNTITHSLDPISADYVGEGNNVFFVGRSRNA